MARAYIHPAALCESASVGEGTRVWAFAHIMKDAVVGADCNICGHTFIESGVIIGNGVTIKNGVSVFAGVSIADGAFIGPNVTFTNDRYPRAFNKRQPEQAIVTVIGRGAAIGANATIICGNDIGSYALVAAGAVVTCEVPKFGFVTGVPARQRGWVCECGQPLLPALECVCGGRYGEVDGRLEQL